MTAPVGRSVTLATLAALVFACSSSGPAGKAMVDASVHDAEGVGLDASEPTDARADASSVPDAAAGRDAGDGSAEAEASDAASAIDAADGSGESGIPSDAGEGGDAPAGTDASADAPPCSPSELWCGGICVPNDFVNCGACGNDCTNLHATSMPSCSGGQCTFPGLTCASGWAHCSSNQSDGCESELNQPAHCGSCGVQCVTPPVCVQAAGVYGCSTAVAVAAGWDYTLAVLANGTVQSWGNNWGDSFDATGNGQLGNGTSEQETSAPGPVSNTSTAKAVAAGGGHACALLSGGTVECWGDNTWGQLGTDPATDASITDSLTPIAVAGLSNVIAIAAGSVHTCALISGGTVECWGSNDHGELGNDTSTLCNGSDMCSPAPVAVSGLSNVTAIAIGDDTGNSADHTCALLGDGTVECWGYNSFGQLGNGTLTAQAPYGISTPGPVSGVATAIAITARNEGACALLSGGGVRCWGTNNEGQIGDGTMNASAVPVTVANLTDAVSLSVGSTANCVCAVRSSGAGVCWGQNANGELGGGPSTPTSSSTPVAISGLTNLTEVAVGAHHACALLASGDVECWGSDGDGQLANATADLNDNPAPLQVQW